MDADEQNLRMSKNVWAYDISPYGEFQVSMVMGFDGWLCGGHRELSPVVIVYRRPGGTPVSLRGTVVGKP